MLVRYSRLRPGVWSVSFGTGHDAGAAPSVHFEFGMTYVLDWCSAVCWSWESLGLCLYDLHLSIPPQTNRPSQCILLLFTTTTVYYRVP